jgi:hypothetical protein
VLAVRSARSLCKCSMAGGPDSCKRNRGQLAPVRNDSPEVCTETGVLCQVPQIQGFHWLDYHWFPVWWKHLDVGVLGSQGFEHSKSRESVWQCPMLLQNPD